MTLATDPRVEVHSTADKLSVAYRRVLGDLPGVALPDGLAPRHG